MKKYIIDFLTTKENSLKILLIISCSALLFVSLFDVVISPTSCVYCLIQRSFWAVIALSCAFAITFKKLAKISIVINILMLLSGAVVSLVQLYYHYTEETDPFCAYSPFTPSSTLLTCSESPTIFGLQIASHNFLLSIFAMLIILIPYFYNAKKI